MKKYEFIKAVPVWQKGMDKVMHHNLIFRTVVEGCGNTVINISASNMYQMIGGGSESLFRHQRFFVKLFTCPKTRVADLNVNIRLQAGQANQVSGQGSAE